MLITPNEGLSEQHLAELAASGIPARRFDVNAGGLWSERDVVQVIEITKLVEEKRGGGVSGTGRARSRLLGARPPSNLCHPRTGLGLLRHR
ncbi:MAG: hypothetical protein NNA25_12705 [Nitrospira sp.]|nr:hypothetical protein [Nitrospira sp.]